MVPGLDTSVSLARGAAGDHDHRRDPSVEQFGREFCGTFEARAEDEDDIARLHARGSRIEFGRDSLHGAEGCRFVGGPATGHLGGAQDRLAVQELHLALNEYPPADEVHVVDHRLHRSGIGYPKVSAADGSRDQISAPGLANS